MPRIPLAALAALLVLPACGTDEQTTDDATGGVATLGAASPAACDDAFAAAAAIGDPTQEELWPAFEACADVEAFAAASEGNPGAVVALVEPETYAVNQCRDEPRVAGTPVCESLRPG